MQLTELLTTVAVKPPRGNCTAIVEAVRRAAMRSQAIWTLTDGKNSCNEMSDPLALVAGQAVFVLIIEAATDAGRVAQATVVPRELGTRLPGVVILFFPEVTPSTWQRTR